MDDDPDVAPSADDQRAEDQRSGWPGFDLHRAATRWLWRPVAGASSWPSRVLLGLLVVPLVPIAWVLATIAWVVMAGLLLVALVSDWQDRDRARMAERAARGRSARSSRRR